MRIKVLEFFIGAIVAVAACVAFAQSQSTSSSSSKQGGAQASASSSSRSGQSGSTSALGSTLPSPTHAILYEPGPNWIEGRAYKEQNLQKHGMYMAQLVRRGVLLFAGPWRDEPGVMLLIRVRTDAEAQAILDGDPAVRDGVLVGRVRAWEVVFQGPGVAVGDSGQIRLPPP